MIQANAPTQNADRLNSLTAGLSPDHGSALAPLVPDDAPFDDAQRHWLNGLMTGLTVLARAAHGRQQPDPPSAPATPITILYGSQSGNAEALSKTLRKRAASLGFEPSVMELNEVEPAELAGLERALVICSTFGEGDPPDNALKFFARILAEDAADLSGLKYSVCGLGDSSYTHFNKSARDLDTRFAELGAERVAEFVACDVAYEDDFEAWIQAVFATEGFTANGEVMPTLEPSEEAGPRYSKANPFYATLLDAHTLSGPSSGKEVNHVELAIPDEDMDYEVGDALGVWPTNCPELVKDVLGAAGLNGMETVVVKGASMPIRMAMLEKLDLTTPTPALRELIQTEDTPDGSGQAQVFDVVSTSVSAVHPQSLVDALRPLQPRLYSIASSPDAHPGQVHLTVGAVRYELNGKVRKGTASTFLSDRCPFGARVGVYVQRSAHFHIPKPEVPLIMIGPGTGIAPFRAFLEHRATLDTPSKNWLFFGDQHRESDFLYESEINAWLEAGVLDRFDAAWSRDQDRKVYVQHRMLDHAEALWQWLQEGAAIYVCGDASRMAKDVDQALRQIIQEAGGMDEQAAEAWVEQLKDQHRYQRDVY